MSTTFPLTDGATASSSNVANVNFSIASDRPRDHISSESLDRPDPSHRSWNIQPANSSPATSGNWRDEARDDNKGRRIVSEGHFRDGDVERGGRARSNRSSGGFLLDGSLRKKRRLDTEAGAAGPQANEKGKARANEGTGNDRPSSNEANGTWQWRPESKGSAHSNEHWTSAPQRHSKSDLISGRHLIQPEPIDGAVDNSSGYGQSSMIDPSQIVRMALSLNESKRLNLPPGQLAPPHTPSGRGVTPPAFTNPNAALLGSYRDGVGSLAKAFQAQGGQSRSVSSSNGLSGSPKSQPHTPPARMFSQNGEQQSSSTDFLLDRPFSPATLARAQKARDFFELSHEYHRLLGFLPQLKASSDTTMPPLGRPYNPLQFIRNRRVRGRDRALIDAEGDGWVDVDRVRSWVDSVEDGVNEPGYRDGDVALLSEWKARHSDSSPQQRTTGELVDLSEPVAFGDSKVKRPKLDWTFHPSNLLADAYWTESPAHKSLIESNHGKKIFRHVRHKVDRQRSTSDDECEDTSGMLLSTARTRSFSHSRSSQSDGGSGTASDREGFPNIQSLSHYGSRTAKAGRRLLGKRGERRRQVTIHTEGDGDAATHRNLRPRNASVNTGPLKKHLDKLLKLESEGDATQPSLQPFSSNLDEEQQRRGGVFTFHGLELESTPQHSFDQTRSANDALADSPGSGRITTPRISIENVDERKLDETNGRPPEVEHVQDIVSRAETPTLKRRPRGFSIWRRSRTPQSPKIDDSLANKSHSEPMKTAEDNLSKTGRSLPPSNPLSRRESKGLKDSDANASVQVNSQDGQAVTRRFFKGGRIGEIVRDELSLSKDFTSNEDPSRTSQQQHRRMASESTDHDRTELATDRPGLEHTRSRSTNDIRPNMYYIKDLPSFQRVESRRSSKGGTNLRPIEDRARNHASRTDSSPRQSRFERLVPLSLDTSREISPNTSLNNLDPSDLGQYENSLSPYGTRTSSRSTSRVQEADRRLKAVLGEPGGVGKGGLPMTGLTGVRANQRSTSRLRDAVNRGTGVLDSSRGLRTRVTLKEIHALRSLLVSSAI